MWILKIWLELRWLHFEPISIHVHRHRSPCMSDHVIPTPSYCFASFTHKGEQEKHQAWEGKRAKVQENTPRPPSKVIICLIPIHFQVHTHKWHFLFIFLTSSQTKHIEIIKSKNWSVKAASSLENYQRARNDSHIFEKFESWSQIANWIIFRFFIKDTEKEKAREGRREGKGREGKGREENALSYIKIIFIWIQEFVN